MPCRGRCLAASGSLSLAESCRDAWRVAASSLRCLGWPSRQAPLARVLCLEWPSRQAPLAGALSPCLEYFVLEWLQRNHRGYWRSPGKPCRGTLRLPVHKFGILGYPYSSTPTGAPGPGPYTAPSAVGPGPKQGTGTRGLGHAISYSVSTALSPNGTRRLRRRGRGVCDVGGVRGAEPRMHASCRSKGDGSRLPHKRREAWRRGSFTRRGRCAVFEASTPHDHGVGR